DILYRLGDPRSGGPDLRTGLLRAGSEIRRCSRDEVRLLLRAEHASLLQKGMGRIRRDGATFDPEERTGAVHRKRLRIGARVVVTEALHDAAVTGHRALSDDDTIRRCILPP